MYRCKAGPNKEPNFGYNASTNEYEDLVKAGVIDPTKVARTALQNAASIAGLMLTTEAWSRRSPSPGRQHQPATAAAWATCTNQHPYQEKTLA